MLCVCCAFAVRAAFSMTPTADLLGIHVFCFHAVASAVLSLPRCLSVEVVIAPTLVPQVDVNGLERGVDFNQEFVKGLQDTVSVVSPLANLTSPNGYLEWMAVSLINALDGTAESLTVDSTFSHPSLTHSLIQQQAGSAAVLLFSGISSVGVYETALHHVLYGNSRDRPTDGVRKILISLFDGKLTSHIAGVSYPSSSVSVSINNKPPVLVLGGNPSISFANRFLPGQGPVAAVSSAASIIDTDSHGLVNASFRVANILNEGNETLNVTYMSPETASLPIIRELIDINMPFGVLADGEVKSSVESSIWVSLGENETLTDKVGGIDVVVDIRHSYIGDIKLELEHKERREILVLHPGQVTCARDDLTTSWFSDASSHFLPLSSSALSPGLCRYQSQGVFSADGSLSQFHGLSVSGEWKLHASDLLLETDNGELVGWAVIIQPEEESFTTVNPAVVPELRMLSNEMEERRYYQQVDSDGRITDITVSLHLSVPYSSSFLSAPTVSLQHPDHTVMRLIDGATSLCQKGTYKHLILSDLASSGPAVNTHCREIIPTGGTPTGSVMLNATTHPPTNESMLRFSSNSSTPTQTPTTSSDVSSSGSGSGSESATTVPTYSSVFGASGSGLGGSGSGSGSGPTIALSTTKSPNYPLEITFKTNLVDILTPQESLSHLRGKLAGGEWTLIVSVNSSHQETSILGWSLNIAREPNVDWSYDADTGHLLMSGVDSTVNYEKLIRSIQYNNMALHPDFSQDRHIVGYVSDGTSRSNSSSVSSQSFITTHHIDIDLDSRDISQAAFPGFAISFTEEGDAVPLVDVQSAFLRDSQFSSRLYILTITLTNALDGEKEGIRVNVSTPGQLQETIDNSTGQYRLTVTSVIHQPISSLEAVMSSAEYFNTADEPHPQSRLIEFVVHDATEKEEFVSFTAQTNVSIVLTNDPPIVDLNTEFGNINRVSTAVEYTEGQGAQVLLDEATFRLTDTDSEYLVSASVTITNLLDGPSESLQANTTGTRIKATYNRNATGQLLLYGRDTIDSYAAVMATVAYANNKSRPGLPNTIPRLISFVFYDSLADSQPTYAKLYFSAVNDRPMLDLNGPLDGSDFSAVFREEEGPILIVDSHLSGYDVDNVTLAFAEVHIENLLNDGEEFLAVQTVVEKTDPNRKTVMFTYLRPNSTYDPRTGTLHITGLSTVREYQEVLKTLTYDNIADEPDPTSRKIRVILNDGLLDSSPVYATVDITLINDSPTINSSVAVLAPHIVEDLEIELNDGFTIADISIPIVLDDDVDAVAGIAITAVDALNGEWEYRTNNSDWTAISDDIDGNAALVLRAFDTNRVRFISRLDFNGIVSMEFVAWDGSDGVADGSTMNATSMSSVDPFSVDLGQFVVTIDPVNDAPVLLRQPIELTSIYEDDFTSPGDGIFSLLPFVSDDDLSEDIVSKLGIAIIEATESNGTWQFKQSDNSSWQNIGHVNRSSAIVLDHSNFIRFVPSPNFNGEASLQFVAWDLTSGEASGSSGVAVSRSDPITGAFSINETEALITVQPVNDSPVLRTGVELHAVDEDVLQVYNDGTTVDEILKGYYSDVDSAPKSGIAVIGVDERFGHWQFLCPNSSVWEHFVGDLQYGVYVPPLPQPDKATLLSGSCSVRFLPHTHFNTEFDYDGYPRPMNDKPYIEIRAWDQTGKTEGMVGKFGVDTSYAEDSHTNEFSDSAVKATIQIVMQSDPPILRLYNSTVASYHTTFVEDLAGVPAVGPQLTLIDYDHDRLTSVTITIHGPTEDPSGSASGNGLDVADESTYCTGIDKRRERILIDVSGTDLNLPYVNDWCPFTVTISANLTAPISHFRMALRTVIYNNSLEEPEEGTRRISFTVYDPDGGMSTVSSTVFVQTFNDAPILDLNGNLPGSDEFVEYSEGQGQLLIVDPSTVSLIDHDSLFLENVSVSIKLAPDADRELLDATVTGFNVRKFYDNATSVLFLTGHETVDNYETILKTVTYENTFAHPGNPDGIEREVEFIANDGERDGLPAVSHIGFTAVNNRPYIQLSGSRADQNFDVTFTEERGPVHLVPEDLIAWDIDNVTLASIAVRILNIFDTRKERLSAGPVYEDEVVERNKYDVAKVIETTRIIPNVTYNETSGELIISGLESLYEYRQVLKKTLTYDNLADEPTRYDRIVQFTLSDGLLVSHSVNCTVHIEPINDPPRFIVGRSVIKPHMLEDVAQSDNKGQTVQEMAGDLIEDDDVEDKKGIAVIGVDSAHGNWQYRLHGQTTWTDIRSDTNETAGLLLHATNSTYVRFVPNSDFNGAAQVVFVAWDGSDNLNEGDKRSTVQTSDTSPFSTARRVVTWTIVPVNDAPVLNASVRPFMESVLEDSVWERPSAGDSIDLFLQALAYDVDTNRLATEMGIAVLEVDNTNGFWQYTIDNGETWTSVLSPQPHAALLLGNSVHGDTRLRFVPARHFNGMSSFIYKIWDRNSTEASGTAGVDVRVADAVTGPFSVANTTAMIVVEPVNDSPVVIEGASLHSIDEDVGAVMNPGTIVNNIVQLVYSDVDAADRIGVAVVAVDRRFGEWEYTCQSGSDITWERFKGDVQYNKVVLREPRADKATLLLGDCKIRFDPNDHFNTEFDEDGNARPESDKPFIVLKGWDNTGKTAGKTEAIGVNTVTIPDDHTDEFSQNTTTATIVVKSRNDVPILRLSADSVDYEATFTERIPPERRVNPVYTVDPVSLTLTDHDHALIEFVTISFTPQDVNYELLTADTAGTVISNESSLIGNLYVLRLSAVGNAAVGEFQQVLRTVSYENLAEEPNPSDRQITFTVFDGFGFSTQTTSTIHIELVNDPPELDLDSYIHDRNSFKKYTEGQGLLMLPNSSLQLVDHDHSVLSQATITILNAPDEDKELLTAVTDGTAILASYDESTSQLILSGPDTVANFSQVLLSVSYNNTYARPGNPAVIERHIEFIVSDGQNDSLVATSVVSFTAINDRPYLDINGDRPGVDNTVIFIEEQGTISLFDSNVFIIEEDNQTLAYAKLHITNLLDIGKEALSVSENVRVYSDDINSADHLTVWNIRPEQTYDNVSGILTITGLKSIKEFEKVLKTAMYVNMADEPNGTPRVIQVILNDGLLNSNDVTANVLIEHVNDSPYFVRESVARQLNISEDVSDTLNEGFSLWNVVSHLIIDDDVKYEKGIAVTAVDGSSGYWEFCTDFEYLDQPFVLPSTPPLLGNSSNVTDGSLQPESPLFKATWRVVESNVSVNNAVVLHLVVNGTNRIRFVPNKDFTGYSSLRFVAWDASDGLRDGTVTSAVSTSETDAFSSDWREVTVRVNPVNDAPVIPSETFTLKTIDEDDRSSSGDSVSALLIHVFDIDTVGKEEVGTGIAIVSADSANGDWQFSEAGTNKWHTLQYPSVDKAVVLLSNYQVRFSPRQDFHGSSSFVFVAWDVTDGSKPGWSDVSVASADNVTGAFSVNRSVAVISVAPINDSPVLLPGSALRTVNEDIAIDWNNGTAVRDIVNSTYKDVDDNAEVGIAVIGVDQRFGLWQWRCPYQGNKWNKFIGDKVYGVIVPELPLPEKATLLDGSCFIRFLPDKNFNTEKDTTGIERPDSDKPYLVVRGWDNTGLSRSLSGQYGQDTTYNTESIHNEFSAETTHATLAVVSVNDLPFLRLSDRGDGLLYETQFVEGSPYVYIVSTTSLTLTDEDHAHLQSVTVSLLNVQDPFDELIEIVPYQGSSVTVSGTEVTVHLNGSSVKRVELDYTYYTLPETSPSPTIPYNITMSDGSGFETTSPSPPESGSGSGSRMSGSGDDGSGMTSTSAVTTSTRNGTMQPTVSTTAGTTIGLTSGPAVGATSGAPVGLTTVPTARPSLSATTGPTDQASLRPRLQSVERVMIKAADGQHPLTTEEYQAILRCLVYKNTHLEPENTARQIQFAVDDGENITSMARSLVTVVLIIDNSPVLSLNGYEVDFVENTDPIKITSDRLLLTDEDHNEYFMMSNATVQISPTPSSDQEKIFANLNQARNAGISVSYESGVLTLQGNAPVRDYQAVLRTVGYNNTEEEPLPGQRNISFQVTDTAGFSSRLEMLVLSLELVNDQKPVVVVGGPFSVTEHQDSPTNIASGLVLSDKDSGAFYQYQVNVTVENGYDGTHEILNVSTASTIAVEIITYGLILNGPASVEDFQSALSSLSYINTAEEPNPDPRKIRISVYDGKLRNDPVDIMVNIVLVNDLPVLLLNGQSGEMDFIVEYTEGDGAVLIVPRSNVSLTDNDNVNLRSSLIVLTNRPDSTMERLSADIDGTNIGSHYFTENGTLLLRGSDTVANFKKVISTVTYNNTKHSPGSPNTTQRVVVFEVFDGLDNSLPAVSYITFTAVNDAPIVDLNGGMTFGSNHTVTYVEEGSPVRLTDDHMTVKDIDTALLQSATVRIVNLNDRGYEQLYFDVNLTDISQSAVVGYSFESGILTLTGFGSPENYQTALRGLLYINAADEPNFENRLVEFVVNDGKLDSKRVFTVIEMKAVNDEPRLTIASDLTNLTYRVEFVEDGQPVSLVDSSLALVSDDDDALLPRFVVRVTNVLDYGFEALFFDEETLNNTRQFLGSSFAFPPGVLPEYRDCPANGSRYADLDIRHNASSESWTAALKALRYCNADHHSVTATRLIQIYVEDPHGSRSKTRTAEVIVTSVNDPPLFLVEKAVFNITINEDQNVTIPVLKSFFDHEETLSGAAIRVVDQPALGMAVADSMTGDITFYPHPNDYGVRIFTYRACDLAGDCSPLQNITVTIQSVNDPPVPVQPLVWNVLEDTTASVNLSDYFFDVEDDLDPSDEWPKVSKVFGPVRGHWDLSYDNKIVTLTPSLNDFGNDTLQFTVCDNDTACIIVQIAVIISPVNDPPVVTVEYGDEGPPAIAIEDQTLIVPIYIEELEDRVPVTVSVLSVSHGAAVPNDTSIVTELDDSRNVLIQRMTFIYTPPVNFYGADNVMFRVTDSDGGQDEETINVTVVYRNDPPEFGITIVNVNEDNTLTLTLPQGLDITDPEQILDASSISLITNATVGRVSYDSLSGVLIYIPPEHFFSSASHVVNFTLRACDNDTATPIGRLCADAVIKINVKSVNDVPSAPVLSTSVYEDHSTVFSLWPLLTDVEDSQPPRTNVSLITPWSTLGYATYNADNGTVTYETKLNAFGKDTVHYRVCDSESLCNDSVLVVDVMPVNDPPVAEDFSHVAPEDDFDLIAIYQHIFDNETQSADVVSKLRISIRNPISGEYVDRLITARGGELRVYHAHGIITYSPAEDYVGPDSFTYAVCDLCDERRNGELGRTSLDVPACLQQIVENSGSNVRTGSDVRIACDEAVVQIRVKNVNDVPVARDVSATSADHQPVLLYPFGLINGYFANASSSVYDKDDDQAQKLSSQGYNISDYGLSDRSDVDTLSLSVIGMGPNGGFVEVVTVDDRGALRYTPSLKFEGYDQFEFEICDGETDLKSSSCSKATARVHVTSVGPLIVSIVASSSVDESQVDLNSRFSRLDKIIVTFNEDTNVPPYGLGVEFATDDVDRLIEFGRPFISTTQVTNYRYTGLWLNARQLQITIVDEGYPQPTVKIGEWKLSIMVATPCGGFDENNQKLQAHALDPFCLLNKEKYSLHSNSTSPMLTGDWGKRLPAVETVTVKNAAVDEEELSANSEYFGADSQIGLYFVPPFSHAQFEEYCNTDPTDILDVGSLLGPDGRMSVVGCAQLLADGRDANEVYADMITEMERQLGEVAVSNGRRKREVEIDTRQRREVNESELTILPVSSHMVLRVDQMSTVWSLADKEVLFNAIKRSVSNDTIARIVMGVSGGNATAARIYSSQLGAQHAIGGLYAEHDDTKTPKVINVVARDEGGDSVYGNGDTVTIVFNVATDQPVVSTKENLDRLLIFDPPLGTSYFGRWLNMSALQVVIVDATPDNAGDSVPSVYGFSLTFRENYLYNGKSFREGNEELPSDKPHCIGINVCGDRDNAETIGVCSLDSLSCRVSGTYRLIGGDFGELRVPGESDFALDWYWIFFILLLCIIAIVIAIYFTHRYYKKKAERKLALQVVQRWRRDKLAPGKDGEPREGLLAKSTQPWQRPPMQAAMRVNPDPFQNLPDVRPSTTSGEELGSLSRQQSIRSAVLGQPFSPRARPSISSLPDPAMIAPPRPSPRSVLPPIGEGQPVS